MSIEIGAAAPSAVWIISGSRSKPGPLGPFVVGYRAWLVGRGYRPSVVVRSLMTLGHLCRWLERNMLAVDQLTAEAVSSFLGEYRDDRGRLPGASVWPLLEYLRADGAVSPEPSAGLAPVEQLVREYRQWLLICAGVPRHARDGVVALMRPELRRCVRAVDGRGEVRAGARAYLGPWPRGVAGR